MRKSRVTCIILMDGKKIWYPSDIELLQLWSNVESVIYEHVMTKEEYEEKFNEVAK